MARLSYARVLVDVDIATPPPSTIAVRISPDIDIELRLEYEAFPRYCSKCQTIGHKCDSDSGIAPPPAPKARRSRAQSKPRNGAVAAAPSTVVAENGNRPNHTYLATPVQLNAQLQGALSGMGQAPNAHCNVTPTTVRSLPAQVIPEPPAPATSARSLSAPVNSLQQQGPDHCSSEQPTAAATTYSSKGCSSDHAIQQLHHLSKNDHCPPAPGSLHSALIGPVQQPPPHPVQQPLPHPVQLESALVQQTLPQPVQQTSPLLPVQQVSPVQTGLPTGPDLLHSPGSEAGSQLPGSQAGSQLPGSCSLVSAGSCLPDPAGSQLPCVRNTILMTMGSDSLPTEVIAQAETSLNSTNQDEEFTTVGPRGKPLKTATPPKLGKKLTRRGTTGDGRGKGRGRKASTSTHT